MNIRDLFFIPRDRMKPGRMYFLDGLRGVALLMMVFTHGMKNWIDPAFQTSTTLMLRDLITKLPGPLFLFLVGAAYVLSRNARIRKGWPRTTIFLSYVRRSLVLLGFAYLYKIIDLAFGVPWRYIRWWTIDILNAIAFSLCALAVFDHVFRNKQWVAAGYLACAACIVLLNPLVELIPFPAWFPEHLRNYINGLPPDSFFPFFKAAHYVFFGAYITHCLSTAPKERPFANIAPVAWALGGITALSLVADIIGRGYGFSVIGLVFFYSRLFCIVLCFVWLSYQFQKHVGFGPVLLIGSHTMVAYWIHAKIIFIYYRQYLGHATWAMSFWLLIKVYIMTFILTFAYINIKRRVLEKRAKGDYLITKGAVTE